MIDKGNVPSENKERNKLLVEDFLKGQANWLETDEPFMTDLVIKYGISSNRIYQIVKKAGVEVVKNKKSKK